MRTRMPSPSMIVAMIALMVAVGGTAWAATQLPKNSVGPRQLKSQAVTPSKIKPKAVTGGKIRSGAVTEPKLGAALLEAIENPSVHFKDPRSYEREVSGPGVCSSATSSTYDSTTKTRLIFFSYRASRTAETGSGTFTINRPGGDLIFDINGAGEKSGEGFFVLQPGETAKTGVEVDGSDCSGTGGRVSADYFPLELEEDPPEPGGGS